MRTSNAALTLLGLGDLGEYSAPSAAEQYGSNGSDYYGSSTSKGISLDDVLNIFKTGSEVYQNVRNQPTYQTTAGGAPPQPQGMSTMTKVIIGGSVVTAVGGLVYLITRKPKNKNK